MFYLFFTTKRLLENTKKSKHICADATYKLLHYGFPVLIVGTTDKNKTFHPFGVALCCNEKEEAFMFIFQSIKDSVRDIYQFDYEPTILVADASNAITNGFTSVFKDLLFRVMCWFHMKKAYEDHETYLAVESIHRDSIKQDIYVLQLSESTDIFNTAYKLFKKKWSNEKNKAIDSFLNYFDNVWIEQHPGWYEGYAPGVPSTNNGLEATNEKVKSQATLRTKLSFGRFLEVVTTEIIEKWSKERDEDKPYCKPFVTQPTINHSLWVQAFHMSIDDRLTTNVILKTQKTTYMSSGRLDENNEPIINNINIAKETKSYRELKSKKNWTSFEHYNDYITRFWQITFIEDKDEWKSSLCNCSSFQKDNICKHLLLQAIRFKYVTVPLTAQTVEFQSAPKRGRPATISKALQIDQPNPTKRSAGETNSIVKINRKTKKQKLV